MLTVLKDRIRELRPIYAPVDPASRTTYQPGERAQCDLWFPPAPIPLGVGPGRLAESKGMVERTNGYLETSFLPGRTFVPPHPPTSTPRSATG